MLGKKFLELDSKGPKKMSATATQSQTWTITQARYVTSKIAADLDLVRSYYGRPSAQQVSEYAEEAAQLLNKRYLATVEYGFKRDGKVVFSLKYEAKSDGTLLTDDRPGKVPSGLNLSDTVFYSWLTYSSAWRTLDEASRTSFESNLPIQRTTGSEPVTGLGYWEDSRSYSKNGDGVSRKVFKPL